MTRYYYSESIAKFLEQSSSEILGELVRHSSRDERTQKDAWLEQISVLKTVLQPYREQGKIYFEYSVPRLGKRNRCSRPHRRRDLRAGVQGFRGLYFVCA